MTQLTVGLSQINNSFSGANYLPYAAGLLYAYLERHEPGRYHFAKPLYKRVPVKEAAAQFSAVDVAGFSLYVWNYRLSLAIAKRLKEANPSVLIVCGGPHVPDHGEDFLREHPYVDIAVHGEGEETFRQLMDRMPERDWQGLEGISWIDAKGDFHTQPKLTRLRSFDTLPSPYLEGTFANLMAEDQGGEWLALWETNRGCPFQCTFCDWGSATQSKVVQFEMDRLKAEMDWFAANKIEFIFCCDANFGILHRDIDIVKYAAEVKGRTGYPNALSVQNTKNATERAYQVQKILSDAGLNKGVTLSMQTIDQTTLENIKRANISLDTYEELQRRFTEDGVATYSDLILGLPGETYQSFVQGISRLIENGQHNRIQFNNLSVLPNAEMGAPEYQRKHGMELVETKILNIHGKREIADWDVEETQQLVVATASLPPADWRRVRAIGWMTALLHFDKLLQLPLVLVHERTGIAYGDMIEAFATVDGGRYPLIAWINGHFMRRAEEIQQGGPEYHFSEEWLGIWWPDDEWVYIQMAVNGQLDQFYQEAGRVLAGLVAARGGAVEELEDALKLNRAQLKMPFQTGDVVVTVGSNLAEFHRGVLVGQPVERKVGPHAYTIDRTSQTWPSWEIWCREVVWFGNKKGAYLYGAKALDKYYAGHY